MQRGKVLNLSRLRFTEVLFKNKLLIISIAVFLAGIIFGIISVGKYKNLTDFSAGFITDFMDLRNTERFSKILLSSFFRSIAVLIVFAVFGTSMFGVVTVPFLLSVIGVIFGNITAYLYSEFALKGIAFNAVIFLPSVIVFLIVLLLASKEAVNFSLKISSLTFSKSGLYNLTLEFKKFLISFLLFISAALVSSIIDAVISCSFIKYFQL
ncbi:MAG: hypothetical protein UHM16_07165 [Acutalibacteraceae bacterium]|nr:hypothetical protein [Acutalibacteraceae bacterium]